MKQRAKRLIGAILICQLAAIIGAAFTTPAIPTWYRQLNKPSFNPPDWVFGPVWTVLFFLMGISLYLVAQRKLNHANVKKAIDIFLAQLVINILWSMLFFGFKSPLLAFIEIILLWILILITIKKFLRISKAAGIMLIPYLLWVTFAAILNFFIVKLN